MRASGGEGAAALSAHPERVAASAPAIAWGVAALQPEDLGTGTLVLPLSVSLWLRRSGADLLSARRAMLAVRSALLEAAGMDVRSEPVPLMAGDDRTVVLHLVVYLHGLVERASAASGTGRHRIVEQAIDLLDGHLPAI